MTNRFTTNEILSATKERGWQEGRDYEFQDLLIWVNGDNIHSLDDILDAYEDEPCY